MPPRSKCTRSTSGPGDELRGTKGIGYCNITKCCTRVCPEHITITDNAIIPLKERVVRGPRILAERRALTELEYGAHGSGANAYEWLREAMEAYERAERLEPEGSDDATLRWNTCVRLLNTRREISPRAEPLYEPALED
jgi:hypothetical protein